MPAPGWEDWYRQHYGEPPSQAAWGESPNSNPYDPYRYGPLASQGTPSQGIEEGYGRSARYADDRSLPGNAQYYGELAKSYGDELAFAQQMQNRPSVAEAQMRAGMGRAQRAMSSQAVSRAGSS